MAQRKGKGASSRRAGRQPRVGRSGNPAVRAGGPSGEKVRPPAAATPGGSPGLAHHLPPQDAEYPHLLRGPGYQRWRAVLGVVMGISFFLLLTTVVSQAVVAGAWALTAATDYPVFYRSAFAFERASGMLAVNLGIATLIPVACVLMILLHQTRPAWLISVQARTRRRYFLACLGVAMVALNGVLLLSALVASEPVRFGPQPGFWWFLLVILVTSPVQAAAEEVFFRGYLLQAAGSLFAQPWVGVVLSAVVFALFHGTQNLPLFLDRLAFGLLAAILVWRTGGLEAAVAAHVVNNVFAYVLAGLTSSIATVRAIREIGWLDAVFDVGGFALFFVLALLVARPMKVPARVDLGRDHLVR